jgi:hypothetical protein
MGIMAIDYSGEKKEFIAELEAGEYDLDISPNRGMDYRDIEDSDFLAFRENLDSVSSKALIAENFEK